MIEVSPRADCVISTARTDASGDALLPLGYKDHSKNTCTSTPIEIPIGTYKKSIVNAVAISILHQINVAISYLQCYHDE